jgi:ligand-binding SRPBCC domain-containing protein
VSTFVHRSVMPASPEAVFAFHERSEALRLPTPWWSGAHVIVAAPQLRPGARAILRLGPPLLGRTWVVEHVMYDPPREFVAARSLAPSSDGSTTTAPSPMNAAPSLPTRCPMRCLAVWWDG